MLLFLLQSKDTLTDQFEMVVLESLGKGQQVLCNGIAEFAVVIGVQIAQELDECLPVANVIEGNFLLGLLGVE